MEEKKRLFEPLATGGEGAIRALVKWIEEMEVDLLPEHELRDLRELAAQARVELTALEEEHQDQVAELADALEWVMPIEMDCDRCVRRKGEGTISKCVGHTVLAKFPPLPPISDGGRAVTYVVRRPRKGEG